MATDTELMSRFFDAWSEPDAVTRQKAVTACVANNVVYSDPNCPAPVHGAEAVNEMLGHFSANMPGGSAWIVGTADGKNGYLRAAVAFGKDGNEMMRGQYFARRDGDKLAEIVGFMGMGTDA